MAGAPPHPGPLPHKGGEGEATLRIIEVYASIQGESTWAGLPCVFVRLARCNLRCVWCDTTYSFTGGEVQTVDALVEQATGYGIPLIEITGGEPLLQPHCATLCRDLIARGYTVLVETSGSLPINTLPDEAIKIMDLKCPDSGEVLRNHWPNIGMLNPEQDEVKFVLASRRDYEWTRDVIREHELQKKCKAILLSAVFGQIDPKDIVDWMLEDHLPARFQLQMHKFIWPPEMKGV